MKTAFLLCDARFDKGQPKNILSLCADGVEKTGPTTFVIGKTDYTPPENLSILIATLG